MKDSFVIYTKYEEQISLLSDVQAGVLLRSLIKYQSGQDVPKMDAVTSMAFAFIKQQIDFDNQKYDDICKARSEAGKAGAEYGKLGGRPKRTAKTAKGVLETAKTTNGLSKTAKTAESDNDNDTDIYPPLFIPPPTGGEKEKTAEDLFFEKYPKYAKDRAKARKDFDYQRLLEEFEKSAYLRSLYTLKQVNENYALIVTGEFRDKPNQQADKLADINAKSARARWYSERQQAAQNKADKIHDKFMQVEEFRTIERRLAKIEIESAKESIKAEQGDNKAVKQLVKLEQEKNRLIMQRRNIIEYNGKTEEDLLPQWHCKKCSDTGYLPDGKMCDCYDKLKE